MATEHQVTVEVDGKTYSGTYTYESKVVIVTAYGKDMERLQLQTLQAGNVEIMAKTLLREMVATGKLEPM